MEHSRGEYLRFVESAAKSAGVPLFASLNCVSRGGWTDYAKKLVDAGASGLELNMYITPQDPHTPGSVIEKTYYDIVRDIKSKVSVPVAVKLSPFFTNFYSVAENLDAHKVDALVLFNRYFHFDIDTEKLELVPGSGFSSPQEMELPLRWIALMSASMRCDIAATTGVVDGRSAVKQMLAGAKAVQISSVLYRKGLGQVGVIQSEIEAWMDSHKFADTSAFIGKLARKDPEHPGMYDRVQFIKAFVGLE
jgi:dihydroorotate dehydrogenase (fumarate)